MTVNNLPVVGFSWIILIRETSEALRKAAPLKAWLQTPRNDCQPLTASLFSASHLVTSEVSVCVTCQLSPFRDQVLSDGM